MPLSAPFERRPLHTRTVQCQGFRRTDGLWDIEGHMTDVKSYPFSNDHRGTIVPGEPLHDMWLRVTVDDTLTIQGLEAHTDKAPYGICDAITSNFQCLVGIRIKGGFTRTVRQKLGGVYGCTHLVELMGPIATTAFQTIYPILSRERAQAQAIQRAASEADGAPVGPEASPVSRPPPLLNTCHAYASNGELVQRKWPEFYTGGNPESQSTKDKNGGASDDVKGQTESGSTGR